MSGTSPLKARAPCGRKDGGGLKTQGPMSSDRRSETPITDREPPGEIAEPVQPRGPFYRTFNERDFALMADNGEASECVARDNPLECPARRA